MTGVDLEELSRRVTAKYLAACEQRYPDMWAAFDPTQWDSEIDFAAWNQASSGRTQPLPAGLQFPREQWIIRPTIRTVVLMMVDRMLDMELSEEQWAVVGFLLAYGGKERVA